MFSCEFWEISKNTLSTEHRTTASDITYLFHLVFVFPGPGPQFVFTGTDPNLYLQALATYLYLPALAPNLYYRPWPLICI